MSELIEYRVRPVTRYIVTRFEGRVGPNGAAGNASRMLGEYDNAETAYEVGYALCSAEHRALGWPPGDERIQYPRPVGHEDGPEPPRMALSVTASDNAAPPGTPLVA